MVCKKAHGTWKLWQQIAIYSVAQIMYGRETSSLVPKPSRPESQLRKNQSCDLRLARPGDEARKLLSQIELRPGKHTAYSTRLSVPMEMMYFSLVPRRMCEGRFTPSITRMRMRVISPEFLGFRILFAYVRVTRTSHRTQTKHQCVRRMGEAQERVQTQQLAHQCCTATVAAILAHV